MSRMAQAAAVVVLVGSVTLLQWHSVQFWVAQVGLTGVGFSLLLDILGLWLWYQRTVMTRGLGVLASALVLAGPVYWVATPVLDQSARAAHGDGARLATIAALESEVAQRERALARMTGAGGAEWAGVIGQTQAALAAATAEVNRLTAMGAPVPAALNRSLQSLRADLRQYQRSATRGADAMDAVQRAQIDIAERNTRLAELRSVVPATQSDARTTIVVGMQVFALLLFQLGAILAINKLAMLRATRAANARVVAVTDIVVGAAPEFDDHVNRARAVADLPTPRAPLSMAVDNTLFSQPRTPRH